MQNVSKWILSGLSPALTTLLALSLAACGGSPDKVKIDTGRGGNSDQNSKDTVDKPLPAPEKNEHLLRALEELMRYRRPAALMIVQPRANQMVIDGCFKYQVKDLGSTYISASYNCTWSSAVSDESTALGWTMSGTETFDNSNPTQVNEKQTGLLVARRTSTGKPAFSGVYSRSSFLQRPPGMFDPSKVSFYFNGSTYANNQTKDTLTSSLQLSWTMPDGTMHAKDVALQYYFLPAPVEAQKQPKLGVILTSTSDISFAGTGSCLYPIGTFNWTKTKDGAVEATGSLTASKDGLHIGADTVSWQSCLELTPH